MDKGSSFMDLLALAFYLSVLSYCIGLALRALPVPFLAVKKLGRVLVVEGIFSCALTFSYRVLLHLIEYFGSLLGTNWALYSTWLTDRISVLLALITALKAIGVFLSKAGLGFFSQSFIGQVTGLVTTSLTTLIATSIVSTIIYSNAALLIALGVALHAAPFKLTRSVGATLIAITIVFSIGMPLMPSFIATFSNTSVSFVNSEYICTATLTLLDASDTPFGQAIIEGYVNGKMVYKYLFREDGLLVLDKTQGFPCVSHIARIDVVGVRYTVAINNVQREGFAATIKLPNLLAVAPSRFLLLDSGILVESVVREDGTVLYVLNALNASTIKLYLGANDVYEIYMNNVSTSPDTVEVLEWYGAGYTEYTYTFEPGTYNVKIRLEPYAMPPLSVDVYPYIINSFEFEALTPESTLFYATQLFIELTILPLIYVALLVTVTLNVARLLGGTSTPITRIMVSY